jgi:serine/threonine protein kinase
LFPFQSISSDAEKCEQLRWEQRCKIINGIARGLQYMHEDSQLKVVHRDLKASNILLDANVDPKISDFDLARIFGRDQTQAVTNCVVGTKLVLTLVQPQR